MVRYVCQKLRYAPTAVYMSVSYSVSSMSSRDASNRAALLFWLGSMLALALFMGFGMWVARMQEKYLRLYRTITGIDLIPTADQYMRQPQRWPIESFSMSIRVIAAISTPQSHPELERLRRQTVHRWRILLIVLVISATIPIVLYAIGTVL